LIPGKKRSRFFEGKTQVEIARQVGISQAQVSRIEKAALEMIRRHYKQEWNPEDNSDEEKNNL